MKRIRLGKESYRGKIVCFVTICFEGRERVARDPAIAEWLIESLLGHAARHGILLHAYCLMPDHLHVLGEGLTAEADFLRFIVDFKQATGFAYGQKWRKKLWERRFYDHILRGMADLEGVAWYVWMNPVRKGICGCAGEYGFSGSMTEAGLRLLRDHRVVEWLPPWKVAAMVAARGT
jgi:putative transposase